MLQPTAHACTPYPWFLTGKIHEVSGRCPLASAVSPPSAFGPHIFQQQTVSHILSPTTSTVAFTLFMWIERDIEAVQWLLGITPTSWLLSIPRLHNLFPIYCSDSLNSGSKVVSQALLDSAHRGISAHFNQGVKLYSLQWFYNKLTFNLLPFIYLFYNIYLPAFVFIVFEIQFKYYHIYIYIYTQLDFGGSKWCKEKIQQILLESFLFSFIVWLRYGIPDLSHILHSFFYFYFYFYWVALTNVTISRLALCNRCPTYSKNHKVVTFWPNLWTYHLLIVNINTGSTSENVIYIPEYMSYDTQIERCLVAHKNICGL